MHHEASRFFLKLKQFPNCTMPSPTRLGPLTLEEVASVQANIGYDMLTKAV
jgi:hypothetical protein